MSNLFKHTYLIFTVFKCFVIVATSDAECVGIRIVYIIMYGGKVKHQIETNEIINYNTIIL